MQREESERLKGGRINICLQNKYFPVRCFSSKIFSSKGRELCLNKPICDDE